MIISGDSITQFASAKDHALFASNIRPWLHRTRVRQDKIMKTCESGAVTDPVRVSLLLLFRPFWQHGVLQLLSLQGLVGFKGMQPPGKATDFSSA